MYDDRSKFWGVGGYYVEAVLACVSSLLLFSLLSCGGWWGRIFGADGSWRGCCALLGGRSLLVAARRNRSGWC